MSQRPTRKTAEGRAYLALRALARASSRPTIELIHLFALEGLLARIVESPRRDDLVLKGGMLLAAYDVRRPTRDLDLLARRVPNEPAAMRALVAELASIDVDDGLEFTTDTATATVIREGGAYSGVRVTLGARLATAKVALHVDVNVGDPVDPPPTTVKLPRLLGPGSLSVQGYPLTMVLAEKMVTAIERGVANTRWRDFADLYLLGAARSVDGTDLSASLRSVADFRDLELSPLRSLLHGLPEVAQSRWTPWVLKQGLQDRLPAEFAEAFDAVVRLTDPALMQRVSDKSWDPDRRAWSSKPSSSQSE